jgi:hypothetical protein
VLLVTLGYNFQLFPSSVAQYIRAMNSAPHLPIVDDEGNLCAALVLPIVKFTVMAQQAHRIIGPEIGAVLRLEAGQGRLFSPAAPCRIARPISGT